MIGSEALFLALDNAESIVVITDINARVQYVNHAFEKNYGFIKSEVIGKKISILKSGYHEDEEYKQLWDTVLSGNTWRGEILNQSKNGDYIWDKTTISPIKNGDDGKISAFIAVKENITEKKRLFEELKRKQRIQDQLFQKSLIGIILMESLFMEGTMLDFRITSANNMASLIFEIDLEPKRLLSSVLSDSLLVEDMIASLRYEDFVIEWMHPVSKKHIELCGFYLSENQYCLMVVDVSGYKNALTNLSQSKQRYASLVDDAPVMIARYNFSQKLTYANKRYCRFFNFNENDCTCDLLTSHFPGNYTDYIAQSLKNVTLANPSFELETSFPVGGKVYWIKWIVRTIFLDGEKEKEYQLVGMDFTPLKEAEIKLINQNAKLDAVFNNSITGIGVLNQLGDFSFINSRMVELLGVKNSSDLVNSNFRQFLVEDSDESGADFLQPVFTGDLPFINIVSLVKRDDDTTFWGNWYFGPLRDHNGTVVEIVSIMTDFTSRQKLEQQLRDNEVRLLKLNVTKDRFFSIIAHDIKNPFSAIIGLASVLQSSLDTFSHEEIKVIIDEIAEAGEKTYKLLDDLLTWSRMQLGQMYFNPVICKPVLMVTNVIDHLSIVASRKGVSLVNNVDAALKLNLDIPMMEVAIRNLIHNGIKFTESGGKIEVVSSVNDHRFPGKVVISVIDTGIGMASDLVQTLFELDKPNSRTGTANETGTGLGLTLSKEMVEKNNGTIAVFSELGKGSEFAMVFNFPELNNAK